MSPPDAGRPRDAHPEAGQIDTTAKQLDTPQDSASPCNVVGLLRRLNERIAGHDRRLDTLEAQVAALLAVTQ